MRSLIRHILYPSCLVMFMHFGTVAADEQIPDAYKKTPLNNVPLTPSDRERKTLTELRVTADPLAPSLFEHTRPVSVLEKEDIRRNAEPTIGETIGHEPGVSSSSFGPGASRPIIRGNSGERVQILKNGVGTLDVSNTSEDHAVGTNPLTAESIEILRGPESLTFGSAAIGGVVNVTDNTIPETEIGEELGGVAEIRHGTADDELSGAAVLEGQINSINWHVDFFHQDTNSIDIPGFAESDTLRALEEAEGESHEEEMAQGKLENSATQSKGFTVGASHIFEDGFIGVSLNGFFSKYGVPGHAHEEDIFHPAHENEEESMDLEHDEESAEEHEHSIEEEVAGVNIDLGQVRTDVRGRIDNVSSLIELVKFKAAYSNYQHKELEGSEVGSRFENDAAEGRVEFSHAPLANFEGVFGIQTKFSDFSATGEEAFLPPVKTFSPALFLFEQLPVNEYLKLQAGARYEFVNYDSNLYASDEFHPLSISFSPAWDPWGNEEYSAALSLSYIQRAPAATELYADGTHVARQIFEEGDTELGLEEAFGVEITTKKQTGLITGALNLFVQQYNDYINLGTTGDEQEDFPLFNYEAIDAKFWGMETELAFHLHELFELMVHDIDLDVQVDMIRAKNKTDSDNLPRIPPIRTIVGLEYDYKNSFAARIEAVFAEAQDRTAKFELPTDSYQLLNASVTQKIELSFENEMELFARGTNLTDEEVRIHSSFLKDLAPLRGRSFLFGTTLFF